MDIEKFAAFLQERRKALGLTQSALAEKLHVTDKAVSRWERGVGFPDIRLLEPLADALGVSLTELMHAERIPPEEAELLTEETEALIDNQKKLTWQRRAVIGIGYAAMYFVCFFLLLGLRQGKWDLPWMGYAVYTSIALILAIGTLTIHYFVRKTWLTQKPWGIWSNIHSIIVSCLIIISVQFVRIGMRQDAEIPQYIYYALGSGCMIYALAHYLNHKLEIRGED
ncbi:MAG: helix-turn-helix transcriptional regulator [Oscillospiraceae bacterium]|nr:helix-turn-helix transcriptional regulator [Oscillospiraceae bacterium]